MEPAHHNPVLLQEMLQHLNPVAGEVYVDGTFGAGGFSRAILEAEDCTVIAIDRDPLAQDFAKALKEEFGRRFIFMQGCFGDVTALLERAGFSQVDGFVLDIGVSSMQIEGAERGFSFRQNAPLDMRMAQEGKTAADLVNDLPEDDLANLIFRYGEERLSRRIARSIVRERRRKPVETTQQLADIVRAAYPKAGYHRIDPATRTFQALRIAVNDELGELERALSGSIDVLREGGRLLIVSFHSLEDGIVKSFLYERSGRVKNPSRHLPENPEAKEQAIFYLPFRKPVEPGEEEVSQNSRARSARLRVGIRTAEEGQA